MARLALHGRVTYGDAILSRFAGLALSAALKGDLAAFKAQHGAFVKSSGAVAKGEKVYDAAAKKVAALDAVRDKTVLQIADKLPAADLGKRASPFARFSKYAPTRLVTLPYAAQTLEMRSLLGAIALAEPPAEIGKLCKAAGAQNDEVEAALKGLAAPLAQLEEARSARDALIPDWEKCLRHLQDASKVAFRDVAGRSAALFAEPDAIETRVTPKKRAKGVTPPVVPPLPGDPAVAPMAAKAKRKRGKRRGR